jgi:hypothetical protein
MLFVRRSPEGAIDSLHRRQVDDSEPLQADHPEVLGFLGVVHADRYRYSSLDAGLVRVLEDLVDTLIDRNVIRITDLPAQAQNKLFERKRFRERSRQRALNLLPEPEETAAGL